MAKIVTNEREISSLLGYFSKRVQTIFAVYGKDIKKRARNIKLAWIFFKASADYFRRLRQRYKETSEKYEVYFYIFYSECTAIFDVYIKR